MQTDLFQALLDKHNPRGHPILAALLYAYCPAAARWWLAGADPVDPKRPRKVAPPFDPTWAALADLAGGETLKEALTRHGFGTLMDEAQKYVAAVDSWRARHKGTKAPELSGSFAGGQLALDKRFGLKQEIRAFGGDWRNFLAYIRAWAFVIPDWERVLGLQGDWKLQPVRLVLTLRGVRRPAYWTTWLWVGEAGKARRRALGLLAAGLEPDQLRVALVRIAGPEGDRPWPAAPEVWLLDPKKGGAAHADIRLTDKALPDAVARLAAEAEKGPHAPLGALQGMGRCRGCGFFGQCFLPSGELSPLALHIE